MIVACRQATEEWIGRDISIAARLVRNSLVVGRVAGYQIVLEIGIVVRGTEHYIDANHIVVDQIIAIQMQIGLDPRIDLYADIISDDRVVRDVRNIPHWQRHIDRWTHVIYEDIVSDRRRRCIYKSDDGEQRLAAARVVRE